MIYNTVPSQVVLLGAGGFLGCAFARFFDSRGLNTLCISRSFQWQDRSSSGRIIRLTSLVSDTKTYLKHIKQRACIIYMAGSTDIYSAEQDGILDISMHLEEMSQSLEPLLSKKNLHSSLLLSSAGAVYGECLTQGCHEDAELKPKSIYGLRNVIAEQYYKYICLKYEARASILRVANPYGPEQLEVRRKGLIVTLILSAQSGSKIVLRGSGEQTRDYIYSEDLCRIILRIIMSQKASGHPINIASGKSFNANEIAKIVSGKMMKNINIEIQADQSLYEVSNSSLFVNDVYASEIKVSLIEGIGAICKKCRAC